MSNDIQRLQERVVQFGKARDWSKFHSPKNIAMALSVEAAEIMEHFQWLKEEQSEQLSDEQKKAVGYESVSYTHLTLPTILRVWRVGVSFDLTNKHTSNQLQTTTYTITPLTT